jgi:hypothetical protein
MTQSEQDEIAAVEVSFPPEQIQELDTWIAEHGSGLTRPDAIKRIVMRAIATDREWRIAKSSADQQEVAKPAEPA